MANCVQHGTGHGNAAHANSVVAVKAATGEVAWAFQTTHHDVWDYDVPAQPTLAMLAYRGGPPRPAVIQTTKQGLVFTLDRETGRPIIPVEDRDAPEQDAFGCRADEPGDMGAVTVLPAERIGQVCACEDCG